MLLKIVGNTRKMDSRLRSKEKVFSWKRRLKLEPVVAITTGFIGRSGDNFLKCGIFGNMYEAKVLTKQWVTYYNAIRPHSSQELE